MSLDKKSLDNIKFVISIIFSLSSLFVLCNIAREIFIIGDINYKLITFLLMMGILYYFITFKIIKKNIHRLILFFILTLFFFLIYIYHKDFFIIFIEEKIINNVYSIYNSYYNFEPTFFSSYKPLLITFLPCLYVLLLFTMNKISLNFMAAINFLVLIGLWFFEKELCNKYLYIIIFLNFLFIVISSFISMCKRDMKIHKEVHFKYYTIFIAIIPVIFVFCFILKTFPLNNEGKISEEKYTSFVDKIIYGDARYDKDKILQKGFGLSQFGYSDGDKKLGGSIKLKKVPLMEVKADKPYFLKGNVKDFYTGYSWNSTKEEAMVGKNNAFMNINNVLGRNVGCFYYNETNKITIKYNDNFRSGVFFNPNLTDSIYIKQEGDIKYNNRQESRFSDVINNSYELYVLKLYNADNNPFKEEIISTKEKCEGYMDYKIIKVDKNSEIWVDNFYYKDDNYNYYNDDVEIKNKYAKYVQLPNNLTNRTYELVSNITKDCKEPLCKVNCIKDYLEKNYKYSLDVNERNKNQEFLDNFLFQEKQGYCTYFATAMTIMCRIEGIPARYVEGFNMNNTSSNNGVYTLGTENAHAWCEVLISPENNIWAVADPKVSDLTQLREKTLATNIKDKEDKDENKEEEIKRIKKERQEKLKNNKNTDLNKDKQDKVNNVQSVGNNKYIKIIVYLTCIIILIYLLIRVKKWIEYKSIIKDKSIIPLYDYYIKSLKGMGFSKKSWQTDLEFIESIREYTFYNNVKEVVKETYKESYGNNKSTLDRKKYYEYMKAFLRKKHYV